MNFRTQIPIPKSSNPIGYTSKIFSVGSCFAENMADKFQYFKFDITSNPFGILFHPLAIENMFVRIVEKHLFTENDIFYYNEQWHSFEVHSSLNHSDKDAFLAQLNKTLEKIHSEILNGTHAIITLGTAWVYRNKESGNPVANCHKVPQKHFDKELLSIAAIEKSLETTVALLQKLNPGMNVIFTVSPVRHIKDGFTENQVSKSHLISAVYHFLNNDAKVFSGVAEFFPSYEILLDELRDYRFYAEDMLHPNQLAIDYIWNRFAETHISEKSMPVMQQVDSIQKALLHKPFHPESKTHKKFLIQLEDKIVSLQKRFPDIAF